MMKNYPWPVTLFALCLLQCGIARAQFIDHFNSGKIQGWQAFTGDGFATMKLEKLDPEYASVLVDARKDPFNVWYAITKKNIAPYVDMKSLKDPDTELRVEARVRIYNPPHRVNFMVNTQRTTVFHHDLMEFELPDSNWHVISMTTRDLDAVPGDSLYIQFNVTDFGYDQYRVDVDYMKADIINVKKAGPDKGIQIRYHPEIPPVSSFSHHLPVDQDAMIISDMPDINLDNWKVQDKEGNASVLTVYGNLWAILRWAPEKISQWQPEGAGVLELSTQAVYSGGNYRKVYGDQLGEEFPRIRVIEIFGGDAGWKQEEVSYNSFMQGKAYKELFNTQMIYDTEPVSKPGGKNYITISAPVMQRLFNGTTKGLLIRPLGAITASFYSSESSNREMAPTLHFNSK